MEDAHTLISSPAGVLAMLCLVAGGFFLLAERSELRFFDYVPPLIFIYATPVLLNNFDVIPSSSPIYDGLSAYALPAFIVLMLIKVNVPAVVRVMGKGVLVMLMGTAGVVVGAVVAYVIVHPWLPPDGWKGYGALAGSWIGGTANLLATSEILGTPEEQVGLAVIADNIIYVVWLPILLMSKNFATQFNRWARVPEDRISSMEAAAEIHIEEDRAPVMTEYLYLAAVVASVTWLGHALAPGIAAAIAGNLPPLAPVFGETTVRILLITTIALVLSITPVSRLPNSTALGTMLVYVFVAGMGARASISGLASAPAFVAGAFIWIAIHGAFCLLGARLFHVDVHSVAIASAANIGAAASAPIVAAHHRPSLVPVSILMALLGYALGNYLAPLAGTLAKLAAGQ
ncbi:MAG: DUF819 family protein [Woeseiaceae bacterium]|jgi:uncharacterized membrane protein|nr:DUF819 family protein [Woeseiaceae bacterium]